MSGQNFTYNQCDQIGRFIALWATFLSLWQQLFTPILSFLQHFQNLLHLFLGLFSSGQNIVTNFPYFYAFWQILIVVNGQKLNKNLAIWSHCHQELCMLTFYYRYCLCQEATF